MTWAFKQWDHSGGYLVIRWCRSYKYEWLRWPHFLWLPGDKHQELEHVIPNDDTALTKKTIPQPWFHPVRVKGDDGKCCNEN